MIRDDAEPSFPFVKLFLYGLDDATPKKRLFGSAYYDMGAVVTITAHLFKMGVLLGLGKQGVKEHLIRGMLPGASEEKIREFWGFVESEFTKAESKLAPLEGMGLNQFFGSGVP